MLLRNLFEITENNGKVSAPGRGTEGGGASAGCYAPPPSHAGEKKANRNAGWLLLALFRKRNRSLYYCSRDMTSDEVLFDCFNIAVPACSSIWLDVMFDDSAAKSVSMMRPVAALVLVDTFDRLL